MPSTRFAHSFTMVSTRFALSITKLYTSFAWQKLSTYYAHWQNFLWTFFKICRATLSVRLHYEVGSCEVGELRSGGVLLRSGQLRSGRITKWWGPLTKWAVTKWANYEVGGLSYEVGNYEVGGKKLRSGATPRRHSFGQCCMANSNVPVKFLTGKPIYIVSVNGAI